MFSKPSYKVQSIIYDLILGKVGVDTVTLLFRASLVLYSMLIWFCIHSMMVSFYLALV